MESGITWGAGIEEQAVLIVDCYVDAHRAFGSTSYIE